MPVTRYVSSVAVAGLANAGFVAAAVASDVIDERPGGIWRDGRWAGSPRTACGIHWTHNGRPVGQVAGS